MSMTIIDVSNRGSNMFDVLCSGVMVGRVIDRRGAWAAFVIDLDADDYAGAFVDEAIGLYRTRAKAAQAVADYMSKAAQS